MRFACITALALAGGAQAEESAKPAPATTDSPRYLLGVSLATQPEYDGAGSRENKLKPLWAFKFGRVRFSTSGASNLLGFGQEEAGGGASTSFIDNAKLRLGAALRVDSGRTSSDASTTRGLPDVKRTLRARLYANYSFTKDFNVGATVSQDLLGRRGGMTLGVDLGLRLYRSPTLEWTSGIGLSAGNAQNLRSYFGVPESAVAVSGKPAYEPGAGLKSIGAGVSFIRPLDRHWLVFGSAGVSQLLGPVADSPLVERKFGSSAAIGLAWRN